MKNLVLFAAGLALALLVTVPAQAIVACEFCYGHTNENCIGTCNGTSGHFSCEYYISQGCPMFLRSVASDSPESMTSTSCQDPTPAISEPAARPAEAPDGALPAQ